MTCRGPRCILVGGELPFRTDLRNVFRRLRRSCRNWSFPIVGWLSAGMYLLVAGGVPLPIPTMAAKDRSSPFPCMDSPCGCQNAEQCWTSCCCHTRAERLAWAREHGVEPPRGLVVHVDAMAIASPPGGCCSSRPAAACCSTKRSCCASRSASNRSPRADAAPRQNERENSTILGIRALACHGFGTDWLTCLIALPPTIVSHGFRPIARGGIVIAAVRVSSPAFPPPVPPPKNIA